MSSSRRRLRAKATSARSLPPGVTIDDAELVRRINADKLVESNSRALERTEAVLKALWDKFDANITRLRERFIRSANLLDAESNRNAARDRLKIRLRVLREIMIREAFVRYHQSQKHFTKPFGHTFHKRSVTAPPATDNPQPATATNETHQG